jgi:hypothetical protein
VETPHDEEDGITRGKGEQREIMTQEMRTLANGARQLVVQEALETMGAEGSYLSALTPTT